MGACFSYESSNHGHGKPSAMVVSATGQLRHYPIPITVSQLLQFESSSPEAFFLCNSDSLYFDDYIPSLDSHEQLQPAQIYFVLPISKLNYRLAASDMAALAVKASVALEQTNNRRNNKNKKARISPVLLANEDSFNDDNNVKVNGTKISATSGYYHGNEKLKKSSPIGVSRSGSVRKLSRYSSKRAKMAVRSFRIKLTTINEGSVLVF